MIKSFALGQTVHIAAGTYHGSVRPATATVIGEGAQANTYKVINGGWHMTFHAGELTDAAVVAECEFWAAHYAA